MDGPQIRALAERLTDQLGGCRVERIEVPESRWQANVILMNCASQVIQRVRAHGRWLFFDFSHGVTWATHLLAKSQWQVGRTPNSAGSDSAPTEPPSPASQKASRPPLLTLKLHSLFHAPAQTAVLTGRPLFLVLPTDGLLNHPALKDLGPDPFNALEFTMEFPPRLRAAAQRTLASALLDQSIVAGITNPLKCELLFALRLHPATRVASLLASQIDAITVTIPTVFQEAYLHAKAAEPFVRQVYDHAHDPCPRCQTPLLVDRSGSDGHWSWYCPACQIDPADTTLFSPHP